MSDGLELRDLACVRGRRRLFRELFMVIFNDAQGLRPQNGTRRN